MSEHQYNPEAKQWVGPTKLLATTELRIVSMINFRDKIYLATEHGVFVHDPSKGALDFQQLQLVQIP